MIRAFCMAAALLVGLSVAKPVDITPARATEKVANDPDDPAIWVNRRNPAQSLILGTNKVAAAEGGALYVFDGNGKVRQIIRGLDRPNNVDVEYGMSVGGRSVDIAVVTERMQNRLRVYRIAPGRTPLTEIGRIPVFYGEKDDYAAPMGIALYHRPSDQAVFAIVGRKDGPRTGYLWQYRLKADAQGRVSGEKVRELGNYSGKKEIEAIAVDDALGYVYYADEGHGIHKWYADPEHPRAGEELAVFGTTGYKGDHEGIAIYTEPNGGGYLISTDQIAGNSEYHVFPRVSQRGGEVAILRGRADETDGIEAVSANLGPQFPQGLLVTMNSTPRNFLYFDGRTVLSAIAKSTAQTGVPVAKNQTVASR
ncbi:MAG: phytase [Armatimonadaceae bacterium]